MLEKSHPTHRNQKREQSRNLSAAILWLISYSNQIGKNISLQAVSQTLFLVFYGVENAVIFEHYF